MICALALCAGMLPFAAFAEDPENDGSGSTGSATTEKTPGEIPPSAGVELLGGTPRNLGNYKVIVQAVIRDESGGWVSTNALPSKFFNGTTAGGSSGDAGSSGSWQWTAQDGGYTLTGQFDSHANVWGNLKYPTSLWNYDTDELQFMGIGKNSYSTEVAYSDDVDSSFLFERNSYPLGVASGTEWRTYIFQQKGPSAPAIPDPTPDDLDNLGEIVNIICTTNTAQHPTITSEVIGSKDIDYTITHEENAATATVTIINADLYVAKYNETYVDHTLDNDTTADLTIGLVYDDDTKQWTVASDNGTATVYVKCTTTPVTPPLPDGEILKSILGNAIKVECATENSGHDPIVTGLLGDKDTDYTVTQSGNTATVTITVTDPYVAKYNEEYAGHTLGENSDLTIGLVYDGGNWVLDPNNNTATVYVQCTVPSNIPDPTNEDVRDALNGAGNIVSIECTNNSAHEPVTSGLRGAAPKDYIITHEPDAATATITIQNTGVYLTTYNKAYPGHVLDEGSDLVLGLIYEGGAWKLNPEDNTATIYVTCPDIVVTPASMVIYKGGETNTTDSNVEIVGADGNPITNADGSLPEIGFYLELSDELNAELRSKLNVPEDEVLNLSDLVTLTADVQGSSGETLSWKLEKYSDGNGSSSTVESKNGRYIYKIVPETPGSGTKLKVSFYTETETTGQKNYVNSDNFALTDSLSETYQMEIYGDRVDAATLKATIEINGEEQTIGVKGSDTPATLTVRYVVGAQDAVVTPSYDTIVHASEVDDPNQDALKKAYVIRSNGTQPAVDDFMVNESNVQVAASDVSLLADAIADTVGTTFEETLKSKAGKEVASKFQLKEANLQSQAQYLDLVDATNGNAWVTTEQDVTIYLPFPKETDANTTFYLAHFDGLDRNTSVDAMEAAVESKVPTVTKVAADQYGVYFEASDFSPYVLVWDTTKTQPTTPDDDNDDDNNNDNNNATTTNNNNTSTTNVSVNNNAAAAAPAATAAIPQTGDAMPVGLLGGVAVVAALSLIHI